MSCQVLVAAWSLAVASAAWLSHVASLRAHDDSSLAPALCAPISACRSIHPWRPCRAPRGPSWPSRGAWRAARGLPGAPKKDGTRALGPRPGVPKCRGAIGLSVPVGVPRRGGLCLGGFERHTEPGAGAWQVGPHGECARGTNDRSCTSRDGSDRSHKSSRAVDGPRFAHRETHRHKQSEGGLCMHGRHT